ncbi:MAG: T9SS type A sorting domain-containing protein, partial [Flavobacteriaceae bacterium]|nr:T9SS type A sorting domain-containing protein [Flavobacteriaceae bacterium]
PTQVRNILRQTAREDSFTGAVPNANWGYGKLDALAAIERTLSLNENTLSQITLAPNPTRGAFSINLGKTYDEVTVQVRNIMGQTLQNKTYSNTQRIEDEIRSATGMYFVTVSFEGASETFKILKN